MVAEPTTVVVSSWVVVVAVVVTVAPPPTVVVTVTELTVVDTLVVVVDSPDDWGTPLWPGENAVLKEDSGAEDANPQPAKVEVTAAKKSREAKATLSLFKRRTKW